MEHQEPMKRSRVRLHHLINTSHAPSHVPPFQNMSDSKNIEFTDSPVDTIVVSKAFQVLSDSNKRSIYDQTGADPDSRAAQQQQSPFSRATARHNHGGGGGGGGFQGEELSPEDLFRFFFGQGGGGGAQFGGGGFGNGGGGFRTQFYGPGMGQQQAQQRQQQQRAGGGGAQQQGGGSIWLQVAPLLVLIAFSLLTQIPSFFSSLLGGASGVADPEFRFTPSEAYNVERTTQEGGIDYYVNPRQFSLHPIYESIVRSNPDLGWSGAAIEKGSAAYKASLLESILSTTTAKRRPAPLKRVPSALARFESKVTRSYVRELTSQCQRDLQDRSERLERSKGFLGFGADWNKVRLITAERSQVCEQLKKMGYNVQY